MELILLVIGGLVAGALAWGYHASAGPVRVRLGTVAEVDKRIEDGVEDWSQVATCTPLSMKHDVGAQSSAPITVKSKSMRAAPGTTYSVNLAAQTCTCDDFRNARAGRPLNHTSRWCRHLMVQLDKVGALKGSNPWLEIIAGLEEGGPRSAFLVQRPGRRDVLVAIGGKSSEWFDVYAPGSKRKGEKAHEASGPIDRFGWSQERHEWSYGDGPPGARELRRILTVLENRRFKVF